MGMPGRSDALLRDKSTDTLRRRRTWCGLAVVGVVLVVMAGLTPSAHSPHPAQRPQGRAVLAADLSHGILPPNHPGANVATQVAFNCNLFVIDNSADCIYSALLNINYARSLEGVGPMILPGDYTSLAPSE